MDPVNGMFGSMDVSLSALRAQRQRMDTIAANLANAETTRTPEGGPYQRKQVLFESVLQDNLNGDAPTTAGVRVSGVVSDTRPPIQVHMPGHPDADANGNVQMPDIRPYEELVDMISSSHSSEANSAALKISRQMFQRALDIGKA